MSICKHHVMRGWRLIIIDLFCMELKIILEPLDIALTLDICVMCISQSDVASWVSGASNLSL